MPLHLPRYTVLLADPEHPDDPDHATEHEATILHGDQLRAELEGPRHALSDIRSAPMHHTTLWLWASLTRTHVIDTPFQEFKTQVLAFQPIKTPADETPVEDPTKARTVAP